MSRVAFFVWLVLGTTLMGMFITVVLVVPSLAKNEMSLMIPAAITGLVVAIPFSILIAKQMKKIGVVKK